MTGWAGRTNSVRAGNRSTRAALERGVSRDQPFRSDEAVARGSLSREQVRDRYYRKLFARVVVHHETPLTLALLARAAGLVDPAGVVAGPAAAALWGADCSLLDVTVDLVSDVTGVRSSPGLRRRRGRLPDDEVTRVDGVRLTTPARTAFDVGRWLPPDDAVVLTDALCRVTGLLPADVGALVDRHPAERDRRAVRAVLDRVDARSPTPAASRLRLGLCARGLPRPVVGRRLLDRSERRVADALLAWPEHRTAATLAVGDRVAARDVGWELVELPVDLGSDRLDAVAHDVRWSLERWSRPSWAGSRRVPRLADPPGADGWCDGGLSRLVEV